MVQLDESASLALGGWAANPVAIPAFAGSIRIAARRSMFQRAGLIFSILLLAVTCTRFLDLFLTFMRIPMVLFILAGTCAAGCGAIPPEPGPAPARKN
jgi:hypothetical protein